MNNFKGEFLIRKLSQLVPQSRVRDSLLWRISDAINKTWPDQRVSYVSERGFTIKLDLTDPNQRAIYLLGRYERDLVWVIDNLLVAGDEVLEAGTNIGVYTLMLAQRIAPGHVYGFEPLPPARQVAVKHITDNGFGNVELSGSALGSETGTAEIHCFDDMPQGHASLADLVPGKSNRYICDVTTIDKFVDSAHIDKLRLVKLDVEGAELGALIGGRQTLLRMHPVAFVEANFETAAAFGYSPHDIISFLETLSYLCYVVRRRRWELVKPGQFLELSENLLFVPSHDMSTISKVNHAVM